jgi:hypothetical protein
MGVYAHGWTRDHFELGERDAGRGGWGGQLGGVGV